MVLRGAGRRFFKRYGPGVVMGARRFGSAVGRRYETFDRGLTVSERKIYAMKRRLSRTSGKIDRVATMVLGKAPADVSMGARRLSGIYDIERAYPKKKKGGGLFYFD